jgi:predicted transcriptional regulator YdeE
MEIYTLKKDMEIVCVTAKSFPYEIKQAFGSLISLLSSIEDRTFFGIAYQNKEGDMIYKAAVLESYDGEAEKLGCEKFTIEKGEYLTETLKDWKKDESRIGLTFRKFSESKYNATFPCVEWYQGNDVMCMVKLEK